MTADRQQAHEASEEALLALATFIRIDRLLGAQLPAARRQFFGDESPSGGGNGGAARRFLEWFGLERRADGCGGPPVAAFVAAGCPGLQPELRPAAARLVESRVGVFVVREREGDEAEVEDALGGERLRVWLPIETRGACEGGTIAGRLWPADAGATTWIASGACVVLPGAGWFEALADEADRLSAGAETPLAPLSQRALEEMLSAAGEREATHAHGIECELDALWEQVPAGLLPSVPELSADLAASPSPGSVIGPLLERVAFETRLDIHAVQRLLLRLWNAHRLAMGEAPGEPEMPAARPAASVVASEDLGPQVAAELEAGIAAGEDIENLFGRLEQMVEAAGEGGSLAKGEPDELRWHTEDEGNAAALVVEYLWDRERSGNPVAATERSWLDRYVTHWRQGGLRDVERVGRSEILAPLVEPWSHGEPESCLAGLAALVDWMDWLASEQDMVAAVDAAELLEELRQDRLRWRQLEALWRDHVAMGRPQPWQVEAGPSGAGWNLHAARGELQLPSELPLRTGDVVLGSGDSLGFAPGFRLVPPLLATALREP